MNQYLHYHTYLLTDAIMANWCKVSHNGSMNPGKETTPLMRPLFQGPVGGRFTGVLLYNILPYCSSRVFFLLIH